MKVKALVKDVLKLEVGIVFGCVFFIKLTGLMVYTVINALWLSVPKLLKQGKKKSRTINYPAPEQ